MPLVVHGLIYLFWLFDDILLHGQLPMTEEIANVSSVQLEARNRIHFNHACL
jgi:hypothetical protein